MCNDCGCQSHDEATVTLPVSGMSCSHCRQAVEKALNRLPGVFHVHVDLEKGCVSFNLSDEIDINRVKAVITDAGFEVG